MLRIISGEFRRRQIETPPDALTTRPLPDRVRVALFNMLSGHLEGYEVMDVFAGTGAFGLEALSRGASRCVFVERDRRVAALLKRNLEALGVPDERAAVVQADALGPAGLAAAPRPMHVVFFDPPYPVMRDPAQRARVLDQFARVGALADPDGFAILRTPWPFADEDDDGASTEVDLAVPGLDGPETHRYGSTAVHWYAPTPPGAP